MRLRQSGAAVLITVLAEAEKTTVPPRPMRSLLPSPHILANAVLAPPPHCRGRPQVESSQSMIRIVGLSATLPNYRDVARFLGVNSDSGERGGCPGRDALQAGRAGVDAHQAGRQGCLRWVCLLLPAPAGVRRQKCSWLVGGANIGSPLAARWARASAVPAPPSGPPFPAHSAAVTPCRPPILPCPHACMPRRPVLL